MSIIDDFVGVDVKALFDELDEIFSEAGERRFFMEESRKLASGDLVLLQAVLGQKISRDDMLQAIDSVEDPVSVINTLRILNTELRETDNKLLFEFLFAMLERPDVYKQIDNDGAPLWEDMFIDNPALTEEQINVVWRRKKRKLLRMSDPYMVQLIVANPECPVNILEDLLDYDDRSVLSGIARSKNVSPEIIHRYLNSPRKPDRKALAGNRYVAADVLMALMRDRYEDIVKSAKRNYFKRFDKDALTDEAIAAAVAQHIDKPHVTPTSGKKAFNPQEAEDLGIDHVVSLKAPIERKKVAEWTRNPDIHAALAADASVAVRRVVAERGLCTEEQTRTLLHDADLQTSNNAFEVLKRRRPDATAEELYDEEILNAAYDYINRHVNENRTKATYDMKLNARAEAELKRATLVAGSTSNEMLQNRILHRLKDSQTLFTIRGMFVSALVGNRHLCDNVIRKLVLEMNHGVGSVLQNCRNPDLLDELLADERLPASWRELAIKTRDELLVANQTS